MQGKRLLSLALFLLFCGSLRAQDENCSVVVGLGRMARAKSVAALAAEERKAGDGYRAQVVFHARLLELDPKSRRAANSLLGLIPKDEKQELVLMTLGDSLCDGESLRDMNSLDRLGQRIPSGLARAVLLVPEKMQAYVSYARHALQDPHNDYAVQMERVCRARHDSFLRAVNQLADGIGEGDFPTTSAEAFRTRILDPKSCHALALPEAD